MEDDNAYRTSRLRESLEDKQRMPNTRSAGVVPLGRSLPKPPEVLEPIEAEIIVIGLRMGSERLTGAVLQMLWP
jgi:hypothetical protein